MRMLARPSIVPPVTVVLCCYGACIGSTLEIRYICQMQGVCGKSREEGEEKAMKHGNPLSTEQA